MILQDWKFESFAQEHSEEKLHTIMSLVRVENNQITDETESFLLKVSYFWSSYSESHLAKTGAIRRNLSIS
eukprot:IDg14159t1